MKLQPKARQSHLLRSRDGRGDDRADIIDVLTMELAAQRLGDESGGRCCST